MSLRFILAVLLAVPAAAIEMGLTIGIAGVAPPGGVPEPAIWALLLGGFGVVGVAARRRLPVVVTA